MLDSTDYLLYGFAFGCCFTAFIWAISDMVNHD